MGADDRLRLTLPARVSRSVASAAAAAGMTPTEWVIREISPALNLATEHGGPDLVTTSPEPAVVVRLAARPLGETRVGWVPDMSPADWWRSASGIWRLAIPTRATCRVLAAADPHGIVRRLWRISGWQAAGDRWRAVGGRDITDSLAHGDQALRDALVGHQLKSQRNPVHIISGEAQIAI